jgi:hypothetical protein
MRHFLRWSPFVLVLFASLTSAQESKSYGIKIANTEPPKELSTPIRKLLDANSVQFLDAKGGLIAELWFRKDVPVDATPEQVKNGLGYRDLKETTVFGAVRFDKASKDYRQQTIKPGVYTLRLAFQPQDGDHMGTAPYPEFFLLSAASEDKSAGTMEPKALQEMSIKSMGTSHPGVLLLFPNNQPGQPPELADMANNHVVLKTRTEIRAGGTTAPLGLALTLIGHGES